MTETLQHARAAAPQSLENPPDASGRVELNLDPDIALSTQIKASIGPEHKDIIGLQVQDSTIGFNVIDADIHSRVFRTPTKQPVGLPRFSRGKDGSLSFKRPVLNTATKVRFGGLVPDVVEKRLQKKVLPQETTETSMVTVAVYDVATGDVREVIEQPRDAFYAMIDKAGSDTKISRAPKEGLASVNPDQLRLRLTSRNNEGGPIRLFDEVTRQLEANNTTSWKGLTWRRGNLIQEIVWDGSLKKRSANGDDLWIRTFGLKTTRNGRTLSLERMNDSQLAAWLDKVNAGHGEQARSMEDVRMVKTTAETLANRERAMYRHMGWLAVPQTPQEMNQTYRRERQLETAIATETDTGPESLMDESDRLATWLLDYHDALKDDDRITKVVEMSNSLADKQRIKTLNEAIARHGLTHVYDMAAQFKENYLESMRKIDVPLSATEQSQSTVFELLATALQNYPDLLDDSDKSHAIRGMLVDKLVGQTVAKIVTEADGKDANDRSLIRKVRQIVPTGEVNDDGQPTQKIREVLVFNKKFFTAKDSPWISSHQRKIWTQVDKLRKPLQDKAQHVFQMVEHEQTPTDDDYREFGRLLRRSIGH